MQDKRIIIFQHDWSRETVRGAPSSLFIFGDNDIRSGNGGQAVIRGLSNSIGFTTKKYPDNDPSSFFNDDEIIENMKKIRHDLFRIMRELMKDKYDSLVIPVNGFGTGLSALPQRAPKTYRLLKIQVAAMIDFIHPGASRHVRW